MTGPLGMKHRLHSFVRSRRWVAHAAFSGMASALLMAPDFLMQAVSSQNKAAFNITFAVSLFVFMLILSSSRSKWTFPVSLFCVLLLEIVQVNHIAWFGRPLNPATISQIWMNRDEIGQSGLFHFRHMIYASVIVCGCYALLFLAWFRLHNHLLRTRWSAWFALALFVHFSWTVSQRTCFIPSPTRSSLHNTINTWIFWAFQKPPPRAVQLAYPLCEAVPDLPPLADHIILVMGEGCRDDHMSLAGYERPTTPFLLSRKTEPDFLYLPAVASSVATIPSLLLFMNMVREPGNLKAIHTRALNLFRLARQQGYKTFWISCQEPKLLYELGSEFVDHIVTTESFEKILMLQKKDEALIDILGRLTLGAKNFIVLHQRNIHSPYSENHAHRPGEFAFYPSDLPDPHQNLVNTYDNAMHFYDFFINNLFEKTKNIFHKNTYIVFTSDHGELLGEHQAFGHYHLSLACARVPFWIWAHKADTSFFEDLKQKKVISHYETGELLLRLMGVSVRHASPVVRSFVIHDTNIQENYGFIPWTVSPDGSIMTEPRKTLLDLVSP